MEGRSRSLPIPQLPQVFVQHNAPDVSVTQCAEILVASFGDLVCALSRPSRSLLTNAFWFPRATLSQFYQTLLVFTSLLCMQLPRAVDLEENHAAPSAQRRILLR